MAFIPRPKTDPIAEELYGIAERSRDKRRTYLGMSQIGDPCARKLWLAFRMYPASAIPGKTIMIFRFGDLIERELVYWLKQRYKITDQQTEFTAHDCLFRGHCDGVIHGITRRPHILEIKSCNDKKFKAFQKHGVEATAPVYDAQAQCYMGYGNYERALFVIQNKNTSEIFTERIYFNRDRFDDLHQKAYYILSTDEPPPKDETFCDWCEFKNFCKYPEETPMEIPCCRNCHYFRLLSHGRYCSHPRHPYKLHNTLIKCEEWLDGYEKGPVEIPRYSFEEMEAVINDAGNKAA